MSIDLGNNPVGTPPTEGESQQIKNVLGLGNVENVALSDRNINGYSLSSNITLSKSDFGLGNVDNTSDNTKNSAIATLTNKTLVNPIVTIDTLDRFHRYSNGSAIIALSTTPESGSVWNYSIAGTAFTAAATDICTLSSHGFSTGTVVILPSTSGTFPTASPPLTNNVGQVYYTIVLDNNTFKLARTLQDAISSNAIDLTNSGTGVHTIAAVPTLSSGKLVVSKGSLIYLGNQTQGNFRTLVAELEYNTTIPNNGVVLKNGITFALATTPIIRTDTTGINIPQGMLHFTMTDTGISGAGYSTNGGASFTGISSTNVTPINGIYQWGSPSVLGGVAYGRKFIIKIEIVGDELRWTCMGKTIIFKNSIISSSVGTYWWIEFAGNDPTTYTNYPSFYNISVNAESFDNTINSLQPKAQVLSDLSIGGAVTFPPNQQHKLLGTLSAFSGAGLPSTYALHTAQNIVVEGLITSLPFGSGWGTQSAISNGSYLTAEATSTTSQTLGTSWVNPGTTPLLQPGDYTRMVIHGDFPNNNVKTVALDVTGSTIFTTGSTLDTGAWEMTVDRVYLSSSKTNQLHIKFETSTTKILSFVDLSGDNPIRIRALAPIANGDVKIRAILGQLSLRY